MVDTGFVSYFVLVLEELNQSTTNKCTKFLTGVNLMCK